MHVRMHQFLFELLHEDKKQSKTQCYKQLSILLLNMYTSAIKKTKNIIIKTILKFECLHNCTI